MEEINIQEWDSLQPDPISDKTKVELALIDLYNRLAMQIPACLLYTSPSPRDRTRSRMPSSA